MDKKKFLIGFAFLKVFFLGVFYIYFSNILVSHTNSELEYVESIEDIISQIHKEDSDLYKFLLFDGNSFNDLSSLDENEFFSSENNDFSNSFIILNLIDLKQSGLVSSQKLASTIEDYYSLREIREEIIFLYEKDLEMNRNKISNLLKIYDDSINLILSNLKEELSLIFEFRVIEQKKILNLFLIFEFLIWILFFVFLKRDKNLRIKSFDSSDILDMDSKKIIDFISNETLKGVFPTFKDVKSFTNLSHPTVLNKINNLEKSGVIGIKKQGRNKHLFLR